MKKLPFFTLCLLLFFITHAQPDTISAKQGKNQKPSAAFVKTNENKLIKGWLYQVNDSQVVLARSATILSNPLPDESMYQVVPVENIKQLLLKRKGSALKGALIGLGVGTVTGIVLGLASGDDPVTPYPTNDPTGLGIMAAAIVNSFSMTSMEKAMAGGLVLGSAGAITGLVIGALAKKKFIIGGKKEKYRDLQAELMLRLVQK